VFEDLRAVRLDTSTTPEVFAMIEPASVDNALDQYT
jgi:hypothetical protein